MFSKVLSKSVVSVLGFVFVLSLCIGLPVPKAQAEDCNLFGCVDDCEFTQDFRLEDCKFKTIGINPYFILKPGYRLVLESEDEKSVETVLRDTKWIKLKLDGRWRWIKTRVVEERAFEWDDDEMEWVTIEISLNYFAICQKTNAVYYFGELSRDCPAGFDENDVCTGTGEDGESTEGSWVAGKNGAMPGLIMPGTPLKGARYFQEIAAADEAVDRGEIVELGLDVEVDAGDFSGCIEIYDTNPSEADDGGCIGENDAKLYCPGVGLVQDQDLELVRYGFVGRDKDDGDDDDDDDDDDDRRWRKKWGNHHHWF